MQLAVDDRLGDLHRVERRALQQVVGHDPQRQPVLDRRVLADARDVGRELARRLDRRHVAAGLALIDDHDARRLAQDLARVLGG